MISDEPTRVGLLVREVFDGQSGSWSTNTNEGARVELLGGADRGDDAAWFAFSGELELVVASDYIRGPRFSMYELGVMDDYDLGYYLAAANLSDIAAMGAQPIGLLSVIRYPSDLTDDRFLSIARGIRDGAAAASVHNVGGDIGTAERVILSATALGVADRGHVVRRSGSRIGDRLLVSGATGIAGAARAYFQNRRALGWALSTSDEDVLAASWKRPRPDYRLGRHLGERGLATAAQDTSDGLKAAVEQIGTASAVGFTIDERSVRVAPVVARVADLAAVDPLDFVFGSSVDFRLAFTVSADIDLEALQAAFPDVSHIGEAIGDTSVRLTSEGIGRPLPGIAWRHQTD